MSCAAIDTIATPRKPHMSRWSRHDICMQPSGNTDQWSRMKIRAMASLNDPQAEGLTKSFTVMDIRAERKRRYMSKQPSMYAALTARAPGAATGDGRVDPIGNAIMSRAPSRDLHGAINNYSRQRSRSLSRTRLSTSYNEKAREGFKFWYQERPKPTSFGRYGIGAYKTVLGLGSAPRT